MRTVKITAQGPLGWSDSTEVFGEDDLLLTAGGVVKPTRQLREGDVLIRFWERNTQAWTIVKMEWMRREHK